MFLLIKLVHTDIITDGTEVELSDVPVFVDYVFMLYITHRHRL